MKKIATYIVFVLLMGSLVFLYGFSFKRNSIKKVTNVVVEFEQGSHVFLTEETVNKLLIQNQQSVKNKAKSIIDLQELERSVISNPYIESASVFLTINGLLKAKVKERKPIARVNTFKKAYYIDKDGFEIPLSDNYSARVLLITGVVDSLDYLKVKEFVKRILADDFLKKEIIGVHKTEENEFVLSIRSGNQKIEFGNLENATVKFKKLKAFYNTTFADKTIDKYKIINLKYHNQVVCTKQ